MTDVVSTERTAARSPDGSAPATITPALLLRLALGNAWRICGNERGHHG